jgi:hypothetical protein
MSESDWERNVKLDAQIGENICRKAQDLLAGTAVANRRDDLLKIARLASYDAQVNVAQKIHDGKASTFYRAWQLVEAERIAAEFAATDLIKLSEGHYRVGRIHFEYARIPDEPCAQCNGTGRDPSNRRRGCNKCYGHKGRQRPSRNYALRHGYGHWEGGEVIGNRDLEDAIAAAAGKQGNPPKDPNTPAVLYYNRDPAFPE